jgi:uncharacterized small protein (DUF1192 family)
MDWDDVRKPHANALVIGEPLTTLSIAELEDRIKTLQSEVTRITSAIEAKRQQAAAADALFGPTTKK